MQEILLGALSYVKSAAGYCKVKIKKHYTKKMDKINKLNCRKIKKALHLHLKIAMLVQAFHELL
jgi:hypothetical protein